MLFLHKELEKEENRKEIHMQKLLEQYHKKKHVQERKLTFLQRYSYYPAVYLVLLHLFLHSIAQ